MMTWEWSLIRDDHNENQTTDINFQNTFFLRDTNNVVYPLSTHSYNLRTHTWNILVFWLKKDNLLWFVNDIVMLNVL